MANRNFEYLPFPRDFSTCRFLLIGKVGTGKSSTGNTILGNEIFPHPPKGASNLNSVTKICQRGIRQWSDDLLIEVIDTPGLRDSHVDSDTASSIIAKCMLHLNYNPNVIIYVIKASRRLADIDAKALDNITVLLGQNCFQYMVVVFTCEDELGKKPLYECLMEARGQNTAVISGLLEKVHSRYFTFTNTAKESVKKEQVFKLLEMAQKMMISNNPSGYFPNMSDYINGKALEFARSNDAYRNREGQFFKHINPSSANSAVWCSIM